MPALRDQTASLVTLLADQHEKLGQQRAEHAEISRARQSKKRMLERYEQASQMSKEKTAFTYCDSAGYLNPPEHAGKDTPSQAHVKDNLMGIYQIKHPDWLPPHHEGNVHGGWNNAKINARGGTGPFGEKDTSTGKEDFVAAKNGPSERYFKSRRDKVVKEAAEQAREDVLQATTGWMRKANMEKNAPLHSSLRGSNKELIPWTTQDYKLEFFEKPQLNAISSEPYVGDIMPRVLAPSRTNDYSATDYICGKIRKPRDDRDPAEGVHVGDFWRRPRGKARMGRGQARADELMQRPRRKVVLQSASAPTLSVDESLLDTGPPADITLKDMDPTLDEKAERLDQLIDAFKTGKPPTDRHPLPKKASRMDHKFLMTVRVPSEHGVAAGTTTGSAFKNLSVEVLPEWSVDFLVRSIVRLKEEQLMQRESEALCEHSEKFRVLIDGATVDGQQKLGTLKGKLTDKNCFLSRLTLSATLHSTFASPLRGMQTTRKAVQVA